MPRLTLKLPQKLSRVEIIRGKDLKPTDYFAFIPLDKIPLEEELSAIFEAEVAELRNKETEREIFIEQDLPIIHQYYHEISYSEQLKPIPISLEKLPIDSLPLEEVQKQVQQAYEKGFIDGQEVTRDMFSDELLRHQQWVRHFDTLSNKLRASYTNELKKLEEMIISLGIMAAEHILQSEVTNNSEIVINQVKKSIYEAESDTIFKISIHPDNIDILNQVKSSLINSSANNAQIELVADSSIDKGGCVLDTSAGIIDARLSTQLNVIKTKLSDLPQNSIMDNNPEEFGYDDKEYL